MLEIRGATESEEVENVAPDHRNFYHCRVFSALEKRAPIFLFAVQLFRHFYSLYSSGKTGTIRQNSINLTIFLELCYLKISEKGTAMTIKVGIMMCHSRHHDVKGFLQKMVSSMTTVKKAIL